MFDLQKASIMKRISAFILDAIITCILAIAIICGLSAITGYDGISEAYAQRLEDCEQRNGVSFDITEEEYQNLTAEQREIWDAAYQEFISDDMAMTMYGKVLSLSFMMTALGLFLAFFICGFIVPLLFGNGMTLGKKVFSIAVMQRNQVRIRPASLFVRTILGKYAVETMIPVCLCLLAWFNVIDIMSVLVIIVIMGVVQLLTLICGKTNPLIHDAMAWTVVVDFESQMIFDDAEALMRAKEEFYAQEANNDRTY